jgi:hypothetical protein
MNKIKSWAKMITTKSVKIPLSWTFTGRRAQPGSRDTKK